MTSGRLWRDLYGALTLDYGCVHFVKIHRYALNIKTLLYAVYISVKIQSKNYKYKLNFSVSP